MKMANKPVVLLPHCHTHVVALLAHRPRQRRMLVDVANWCRNLRRQLVEATDRGQKLTSTTTNSYYQLMAAAGSY